MDNSERLDGVNEIYLTVMTAQERSTAFDYLLTSLRERGARKTVHRLFLADGETARRQRRSFRSNSMRASCVQMLKLQRPGVCKKLHPMPRCYLRLFA
jgi:hypothetical protein